MGWDALSDSLHGWFADAWSRGLSGAATDLAWIVDMIRRPDLTVSVGLRAVLDAADDGAEGAREPSERLGDHALQAFALDLRRLIERHARLGEPPARYRSAICPAGGGRSAGDGAAFPVRSL